MKNTILKMFKILFTKTVQHFFHMKLQVSLDGIDNQSLAQIVTEQFNTLKNFMNSFWTEQIIIGTTFDKFKTLTCTSD